MRHGITSAISTVAGVQRRRRDEMTPVSKPARASPPENLACSIFKQRFITTSRPGGQATQGGFGAPQTQLRPEDAGAGGDGLGGNAG